MVISGGGLHKQCMNLKEQIFDVEEKNKNNKQRENWLCEYKCLGVWMGGEYVHVSVEIIVKRIGCVDKKKIQVPMILQITFFIGYDCPYTGLFVLKLGVSIPWAKRCEYYFMYTFQLCGYLI